MFDTLMLSLFLLAQVGDEVEQDVEAIIKEPAPAVQVRPEDELDPVPFAPEQECEVVLQYLQEQVPSHRRPMQRFVSFYALPPSWRGNAGTTLSFIVNSLHFNPVTRPVPVAGTDYRVWTFNMLDWCRPEITGNTPHNDAERYWQVWEAMTAQDPYFREPWVPSEIAAQLRTLSASSGAIVRGDWFIVKVTDDDIPGTGEIEGWYSKIMGFPETEAEFQKYIQVDIGLTKLNGSSRSVGVLTSGKESGIPVALNNRMLQRIPTLGTALGGYYWRTYDVTESQGKKNVLNHPLGIDHDGGEQIFSLPNGLQGYYLVGAEQEDGSRRRVEAVPPGIAVDSNYPDRQVRTWHSCVTCHDKGILAPDLAVRELVQDNVSFTSYDQGEHILFNVEYLDDITDIVQHDQDMYRRAVKRAAGGKATPESISSDVQRLYNFYQWNEVTPLQAAREFGVPTEGLQEFLADKRVQTSQGALLMLLRGRGIKRDMFEEEYKNGKLLQNIREIPIGKQAVQSQYSQEEAPAVTLEEAPIPESTPVEPDDPNVQYGVANEDQIAMSGTIEVGRTVAGQRYAVLDTVSTGGGEWLKIQLPGDKIGHVRAGTIDMEE